MASVSVTNQTLTMTIDIDGIETVIRKDNCKVQAFGTMVRITDYKGSIYEFLYSDCTAPSQPNANALRDAIEAFLNTGGGGGGGEYTKYVALLTQTGTDAPVATVLENTLGATISFARDGSGGYNCSASSEVFTDKTVVIMPNSVSSTVYPTGLITVYTSLFESLNLFFFSTYDIVSENQADDILFRTPIEIRVYP
jgi:hypothetical protein